MARRITGGIEVRRRPDGGAVITIKTVTGEAFEIERTADEVASLAADLFTDPPNPKAASEAQEPALKKRAKPGNLQERSNA